MVKQVYAYLYAYILESEMVFLRLYKVNPFEVMKDISVLDLHMYMKKIEELEKKEHESIKKKEVMTALR